MQVETIAVTYARALLELADEKNVLADVNEEVAVLRELLKREKDLRVFVESPRIGKHEKQRVLEKSLRGRISDHVLNFILMIVGKGREIFLFDMLDEFEDLHDHHIGLVRAHVTTAKPLPEEQAAAIRDRLARALGKTVELESRVDEGLLGGFVLRYEGMVADGSLRSALDDIRERMLDAKLGSELFQ